MASEQQMKTAQVNAMMAQARQKETLVRQKFDLYDVDKSGTIEYTEMLAKLRLGGCRGGGGGDR